MFAANLMYTNGLVVGNYQYLIQDLMYSTVLATVMSLTHPQVRKRGGIGEKIGGLEEEL